MTTKATTEANGTTYQLTADITFKDINTITPAAPAPVPPPAPPPPAPAPAPNVPIAPTVRVWSSSPGGTTSSTPATAGSTNTCFTNSQGDLSLEGQSHSLTFQNISLDGEGAAFSQTASTKTLYFSGFSDLIFSSTPPASLATGSGAILCQDSGMVIKNNKKVVFSNNFSMGNGGAACYKDPASPSNPSPPAAADPAATNAFFFQNNESLLFSQNSSGALGGAIYAKNLTLESGGETIFSENTATTNGGAIAMQASGSCRITADTGNITFKGNMAANKRNALYLGSNAKITQLNAKEGMGIYFFDNIEGMQADQTVPLSINKANGQTTYTGDIVFSAEEETNLSQISQPVKLEAGSLILRQGAILSLKSFTQTDANSKLVLEINSGPTPANTSLQASEAIDLKNVQVKLNDIDTHGYATIFATSSSGTITVSGPLTLVIPGGDFYANPDLDQILQKQLLNLATTKGTITLNNESYVVKEDPLHYGYQGIWRIGWQDVPSAGGGSTKTAAVAWQPTGYVPFPHEKPNTTSLVPDNLWSLVSDTRAIQKLIENSARVASSKDFWISSIVNSLHKHRSGDEEKFRHRGSGYAIGASSQTPTNFNFSVGFCQIFGNSQDYKHAKIHEKLFSGSLYAKYATNLPGAFKWIQAPLYQEIPVSFHGQFGFFYENNSMKINYTPSRKAKSSWNNRCFAGDLGMAILLSVPNNPIFLKEVSPFIKTQGAYARQQGFREKGFNPRIFNATHLNNISVSPGVKLQGHSHDISYELSAAYSGDVYRKNPQNTTQLISIVPTAPYITPASNLHRHAAYLEGNGNFPINPRMTLFAQGVCELRKSSINYQANAGTSMHF
ncbi:polymorphic outer membrane protein middle domain-containing protein [Chlamydia vaughanii]|uniref:polymorphic outer membrane protein middle domain-containing protein n=1 Tax=Chlamydia vaughanii TaxID=3112552 RepID=UPI0032B24A90